MKKTFLTGLIGLFFLAGLALFQLGSFNDGKLHVVFCDVGQGDAILIRTPNNKHILIDAGPDRAVLNCLASHMPFWERTIDLVIVTHPHADHFMGMHFILERYNITQFATEKLDNKSGSWQEVMKLLREEEVPVRYVAKGDRWVIPGEKKEVRGEKLDDEVGSVILSVLGPSKDFLQRTSPNGMIGENKEFASAIMGLSFDSAQEKSPGFHAIFTGDSQVNGLIDAINGLDYKGNPIDILQVPHHGSRTGLNEDIVQKLHPKLAVASVGKNGYGHPNRAILDLLKKYNIPVLRTDMRGDVEIVSDGREWRVN